MAARFISCVIRSPADYMAEWENVPLDPKTTKKKKRQVNIEPPRPMAAWLKRNLVTRKSNVNSYLILNLDTLTSLHSKQFHFRSNTIICMENWE